MALCQLNVLGIFLLILVFTSCKETVTAPRANPKAKVIENISYKISKGEPFSNRESLDLYQPPSVRHKPPLLIFVHGGFWVLPDDELKIGPSLAHELVTEGVAIALVRYRLGPTHKHPVQAQDVAAAVAYLFREADRYGYDAKRVYLAGHSAGGHLVSLIALDESYLSHHGMAPNSIAGVIGISGLYDLTGRDDLSPQQRHVIEEVFGPDVSSIHSASPTKHVKPGAPPFLLISATGDIPGFNIDARRFGQVLNNRGGQGTSPMVISDRDHFSVVKLDGGESSVRELVLNFLKLKRLPNDLRELVQAKRAWLGSSPSTVPFWEHSEPVKKSFDSFFLPQPIHAGTLRSWTKNCLAMLAHLRSRHKAPLENHDWRQPIARRFSSIRAILRRCWRPIIRLGWSGVLPRDWICSLSTMRFWLGKDMRDGRPLIPRS